MSHDPLIDLDMSNVSWQAGVEKVGKAINKRKESGYLQVHDRIVVASWMENLTTLLDMESDRYKLVRKGFELSSAFNVGNGSEAVAINDPSVCRRSTRTTSPDGAGSKIMRLQYRTAGSQIAPSALHTSFFISL